jgi:PAS domain S-box-containing protein
MWKTFFLFLAAWRRSSSPCSIGPVAEGSMMLSSANNLDLFRLVVEQAPDGIIFTDRVGVIQIWKSAAAELFGYLPEEVVGRPLDIIIPEHLRHADWEGFGKAVASGHTKHGPRALKTRAAQKAGQKLYVSLAFSIVKDPEGKVIGAMATARLFTEDKSQ